MSKAELKLFALLSVAVLLIIISLSRLLGTSPCKSEMIDGVECVVCIGRHSRSVSCDWNGEQDERE